MPVVSETVLKSFPLVGRGKVRDIFDLNKYFLIVATDRLSAFDVVFKEPIPEKGRVLPGLAVYWFGETAGSITESFSQRYFRSGSRIDRRGAYDFSRTIDVG